MSANGSRPGEAQAIFAPRDEVFEAFDALDVEVRRAINDAPVPFSPIDIARFSKVNGIRGERLAAAIRAKSAEIMDSYPAHA